MRHLIVGMVLLLVILHQDFWFWHRYEPLVFGFIPIGLVWHVGISLSAAFVAFLAVRYCWPADVDVEGEEAPSGRRPPGTFDH